MTDLLRRHPGGFRQLFVNGARRPRARLPKNDYYWIEAIPGIPQDAPFDMGTDYFKAKKGDFRNWKNIEDVDVVALHFWSEERMPVVAYDPETRIVRSSRKSVYVLNDDIGNRCAKYYIDNVFEGLTDPGEWYLDRKEAKLFYIPMSGQTIKNTEISAPVLLQFMRFEGNPEEGKFIEFLSFRDLAFEYGDWIQPRGGMQIKFNPYLPADAQKKQDFYPITDTAIPAKVEYAGGGQAASNIPGSIVMEGVRNCLIENCRIEHAGWYGIELGYGCSGNLVSGNILSDLGGGGVKLDGAFLDETWRSRTFNNIISDNHIHRCGEIFMSSVGVFLQHTFGNLVSHNHIHDLYYTGISCGFVWGYGVNVSRENRIEKNHIHHLGKRVLSDMGGIYILGIQPGTVIRGNLVHDIERCNYGGWGLYLDEGASHVILENNITYNTGSQTFHQHYGRENIVRNNIFAFGMEGLAALSRGNRSNRRYLHCGMNISKALTFERNIFVTNGGVVYVGALADNTGNLENCDFISDLNLFWDLSGSEVVHGNGVHGKSGRENLTRAFTIDDWKKLGMDIHSIVADPQFRDVLKFDFRLGKKSPAIALGFKDIDMSDVGPRSPAQRIYEPDYQRRRASL